MRNVIIWRWHLGNKSSSATADYLTTNKRRSSSTTNRNTSTRGCSHKIFFKCYHSIKAIWSQGINEHNYPHTTEWTLNVFVTQIAFSLWEKSVRRPTITIHTKLQCNNSLVTIVLLHNSRVLLLINLIINRFGSSKKQRKNDNVIGYNIGTRIYVITDNVLHELAFIFGDASRRLTTNLQTYVPRFFQIQQLLKQLLHIVIGLRRRFHKTDPPIHRLCLSFRYTHLKKHNTISIINNKPDCFLNQLTSLNSALSSHLFPTNMTGIWVKSGPLISLINSQIGLSSSKLCLLDTEYTKMNACPLLMDRRCIAGNWWEPVVSVICKVHMFLLQLIT